MLQTKPDSVFNYPDISLTLILILTIAPPPYPLPPSHEPPLPLLARIKASQKGVPKTNDKRVTGPD